MKDLTVKDLIAAVKKHPVGIAGGVLVLVLAVGIYVRGGAMPGLKAELEEKSALDQRQQTNLRYAAQLDEQLAALEAVLAEINERAISPAALANNLQYFYRLEAEHGFKILDLRQGATPPLPKTKPNYIRIPFTLAVEGSYPVLLAMLRDIEQGRHFARVETASLSLARSQGAAPGTLALSLNLELLARP